MKTGSPPLKISIPKDCGEAEFSRGWSDMAKGMVGSSILKIAAEIREMQGRGVAVTDMTVGDFSPREFPIPKALDEGLTNYPPSSGLWELREAVREHILRTQAMEYPLDGIVIVSGGRPTLYSTYRLLCDPGETVVCPLPSWNNHNYQSTSQVNLIGVPCRPEDAFQPTLDLLKPHLKDARMVVLNTPQNPSGGVMPNHEVEAFGKFLVEENKRRETAGEKPLWLLYDQIYRSLVFPGHEHSSPVQWVPECAPYVIHTDGISKGMASTGLRCGWMFGPPAFGRKISAFLTHVGAWAPKPVQAATAKFLRNRSLIESWDVEMVERAKSRLDVLAEVLATLRAEGLPVDFIEPQGAIYMSVRFDLKGHKISEGVEIQNSDDIRAHLLKEASFAVIPFSAFGVPKDLEDGWFRVSVGAVSPEDIRAALPRLRTALS